MEIVGCSKECNDGLWVTVHHKKANMKNKMDDYSSIMLGHNDICHMRRVKKDERWKDTVCGRCYSYIQSSIHSAIRVKMEKNSEILDDEKFKPSKIRTINGRLRYVSFGDVRNNQEVKNIIKHAKFNPVLKKAIWSKMYGMFRNEDLIVKNMNFIWSVSKLDCMKFIIPKGFTKSFYVYRNEEILIKGMEKAKEEGFKVFKCGLQCNMCNRCYDNKENEVIFELLR